MSQSELSEPNRHGFFEVRSKSRRIDFLCLGTHPWPARQILSATLQAKLRTQRLHCSSPNSNYCASNRNHMASEGIRHPIAWLVLQAAAAEELERRFLGNRGLLDGYELPLHLSEFPAVCLSPPTRTLRAARGDNVLRALAILSSRLGRCPRGNSLSFHRESATIPNFRRNAAARPNLKAPSNRNRKAIARGAAET